MFAFKSIYAWKFYGRVCQLSSRNLVIFRLFLAEFQYLLIKLSKKGVSSLCGYSCSVCQTGRKWLRSTKRCIYVWTICKIEGTYKSSKFENWRISTSSLFSKFFFKDYQWVEHWKSNRDLPNWITYLLYWRGCTRFEILNLKFEIIFDDFCGPLNFWGRQQAVIIILFHCQRIIYCYPSEQVTKKLCWTKFISKIWKISWSF